VAGVGGNGSVALTSLTGEGCILDHAKVITPPAGLPAGTDLPYGALDFTLIGCTAGSATLAMSYSGSVDDYAFWKHINGAWITMPTVVMAGNTAILTIEDDGPYDADSTAGVIRDPSGPGTAHGGGGPTPTPIPALSPLALLVLISLVGGLGWWRVRQRAGVG
jgi:hypothetical protein